MAAATLMTMKHRLILIGGEFRGLSRTIVGPLTAAVIQELHVDKAFMGTIGFTIEDGMTTTDPAEAFTKEQVMRRANQVILLADSSKLGVPSFARSGTPGDLDILITEACDPRFRQELEQLGVEVILAQPPPQ
jgi:DeoR/GlpR family transcriptional regulator of sugar metabolism